MENYQPTSPQVSYVESTYDIYEMQGQLHATELVRHLVKLRHLIQIIEAQKLLPSIVRKMYHKCVKTVSELNNVREIVS